MKSGVALGKHFFSVCFSRKMKGAEINQSVVGSIQNRALGFGLSHICKQETPGHLRSSWSSNGNWTKLMEEEPLTVIKHIHAPWISKFLLLKVLEGGKMYEKYSYMLLLFFRCWWLAVTGYEPELPLVLTSRAILTLSFCKGGLWEEQAERILSLGKQDKPLKRKLSTWLGEMAYLRNQQRPFVCPV